MLDLNEGLFEQISIVHGPYDLLYRYFTTAEQLARDAGVYIRIHADFHRLVELNERYRSSWTPMSPMFDPSQSRLRPETAFWLEAVDEAGDTVATHAQRLFVWPHTTLRDEVEGLRVFYAEPAARIATGEAIAIAAPIGKTMTGRTMSGGALWTHPDWRRRGLVRLLPRISRAYGYTRWMPHYIWAFVETKMAGIVPRASGPYTVESGLTFRLGFRSEFTGVIMWMTADTMLRDIEAIVAQEAADSDLLMETPRISRSPDLSVHGMSTRS